MANGNTNSNYYQYGFGLLQVNRLRDYFASCLPFIQKGAIPTIATVDSTALNEMLQNVNSGNLNIDTTATSGGNNEGVYLTGSDGNNGYLIGQLSGDILLDNSGTEMTQN